ncbi:MAG: cell surface protein SprA [Paludibacteraceae bacterium]|nr:cell surface protein SprA [Paludibacteraceae bacterium]
MKKGFRNFIYSTILIGATVMASSYALAQREEGEMSPQEKKTTTENDSTAVGKTDTDSLPLHYPLNKSEFITYEDLQQRSPADLKTPENIKSSVVYDPDNELYIFTTKVGDMDISTPFVLSESEYYDYALRQSMNSYWAEKNSTNVEPDNGFSIDNIQIGLGKTADKIFGPGGVQLKTQGSIDIALGFKYTKRDNPSIPERNRKSTIFDFDTKIQLNANGKVGDRINFTMNYNTEATFDFDQKLINLNYEGKEDNIIKKIEAGNVSLPLSSSLITGSTALFGIRTDLQFGKLKVSAIASQQESESKTISTKGGAQTTEFEITADDYDENRHFFLSKFFYENYDEWMKKAPNISSNVVVSKVEVWVKTSSVSSYEKQYRNVIAFTDLGDTVDYKKNPNNNANDLYRTLVSPGNAEIRKSQNTKSLLSNLDLEIGQDFEIMNSARLLSSSEYTLNPNLGYISLKSTLQASDVLAVAYEYTYKGVTYKVGEFSTDKVSSDTTSGGALFVKLLKNTSSSPEDLRLWNLMMKNVYSLGAYNVQSEKFKLNILYNYQNDSISTYMPYIPEGNIKNTILLRVLDLDRLNPRLRAMPDGNFDYIEGYTVISSNGRIIFPTVEPFGKTLRNKITDKAIADKFAFDELYELTKTEAKEVTEKNKFLIFGEYRSSSGAEIRLGATNVPRGSVRVTAGGRTLIENEGFTVDYNLGIVKILDEVALESNAPINVSLESQSFFSMQRKSLVGTNLEYAFSDKFTLGGTLLHLSEKPLTTKVSFGDEPRSNTIWGLNGTFKSDWQWLTNIVDKIPLIDAKAPSSVAFSGEFAHLIPGHSKAVNQNGEEGVSYIDDFEGTKSTINIMNPTTWTLASTPEYNSLGKTFAKNADPEFWGDSLGNLGYGLNRALMSWFYIDQIMNNPKSSTPDHIRKDKDQLSNHFVRQIDEREIYQNKDPYYGETTRLQTLNISYYPNERGPYNLDVSGMDSDGTLKNPRDRWAGIMRKLDNTDFEKANIEYLEFWLLDPFVHAEDGMNTSSGKLVFNLGEISEDILKDGRISFENGLPTSNNPTLTDSTIWGRVPRIQSVTNSFDNTELEAQDLGLDGLSSEEEATFDLSYRRYVEAIKGKLSPDGWKNFNNATFSPLNDPAGDNFHHYRGSDYDEKEASILERYKYYNGMEGNSNSTSSNYSTASNNYPNTEDINNDRTINEKEQYYEYVVDIDSTIYDSTRWAENFIANKVDATVTLKNGETETVSWFQFKIPVKKPDTTVNIKNLQSIRFIRMYMTGFASETHLRFGELELVRTDWRVYDKNNRLLDDMDKSTNPDNLQGSIEISSVNIEEDASKLPVGYVLPPGIDRVIDPSQTQIRQENEQSMMIRVDSLPSKGSRAIYKLAGFDARQYDRFKMFVHAESMMDKEPVQDNKMYIFLRLGSDFTENYYEYKIPLKVTRNGATDPHEVWPEENSFDFRFKDLKNLKLRRDQKKTAGLVRFNERYSEMDGHNTITVVGNPTFGDITSMMIGVKNEDKEEHSIEIWVNEMRMAGFNEEGGWAALANLGIVFSDLASVNVGGRIETAGFGGLDQNVADRRTDNFYEYNVSAAIQLGKFFPEKAKVNIPFSYTLSKQTSKPEYDPFNTDVKLSESLDNQSTKAKRDSIKELSVTETTYKSYTLSNVRVGITSKTPMPYDPANFSFSLGYNETYTTSPEVEYDKVQNYNGIFNYVYSINPKPVEPFKNIKLLKNKHLKLFRDFNFYYLPTQLSFSTSMVRTYSEIQMRDLTNSTRRDTTFPYLTFDKDFTWDRTSNIKFNLTKALKLSFSSAMNSSITEVIRTDSVFRNVPVNKGYLTDIGEQDWYDKWKDTVWHSIKHFGSPIAYQQHFDASYAVPINKLPFLDWINANARYSAEYLWDKGAEVEIGEQVSTVGNIATSKRTWNGDVRFNLENLYNKSSYLKDVNKKFSKNNNRSKKDKNKENKPKVYERKNLRLRGDKETRINHRLNTKKFYVSVIDKDSNEVKVKYSVIDANSINVTADSSLSGLILKITPIVKERTPFDDVLDVSARVLMMVRNVSANYQHGDALTLPGYMPNSGFLGQDASAPGYGFTFGFFKSDKFEEEVFENNWMLSNETSSNPIVRTRTQNFQIRSTVEPFTGIKIDLNAAWMKNRTDDKYFKIDTSGLSFYNSSFDGSYSKTHIAIKTAFKKPEVNSELFNNFLRYRSGTMFNRVKNRIQKQSSIDASTIDEKFSYNTSDVLVPAFLAAYTGSSPNSSDLDILPAIWTILPNWKLTVDVMPRIEYLKENFKSFNINHAYKCTYNINSYTSLTNWEPWGGDYGFVGETAIGAGNDYITSQTTLDNVNISEAFSPLIGIDATLKNSLNMRLEYKKSRTAGLDVPALQIIESHSKEFVFGTGYRIDDFGMIINLNNNKQKKVKNDLNLKADFSIKNTDAFIRKIEDEYSQLSNGLYSFIIKFSAEYVFSEKLNIRFYYDRTASTPKISQGHPTVNSNFGLGFRFLLTR